MVFVVKVRLGTEVVFTGQEVGAHRDRPVPLVLFHGAVARVDADVTGCVWGEVQDCRLVRIPDVPVLLRREVEGFAGGHLAVQVGVELLEEELGATEGTGFGTVTVVI